MNGERGEERRMHHLSLDTCNLLSGAAEAHGMQPVQLYTGRQQFSLRSLRRSFDWVTPVLFKTVLRGQNPFY